MGEISTNDPEVKKTADVAINKASNEDNSIDKMLQRLSSWTRLKKITAWIRILYYKKILADNISNAKQRNQSVTNQTSMQSHL